MLKNLDSYRPCVGVVLLNKAGKVFIGRRNDKTKEIWQLPQGGIEPGEDAAIAAKRELYEETGVRNVKIIKSHLDWLSYDLPEEIRKAHWGGKYLGQKQKWFLMEFLGDDAEINVNSQIPEFDAWRWIDKEELLDIAPGFKRDVYQKIIAEFLG
jgi:putative (di)nucleoside polyphosphate hydrolase